MQNEDILIDSRLEITCAEIISSEELAIPDPSGEVIQVIVQS